MAQRNSKQESTLELVLRLVNQLGPEEQDEVAKELRLMWLRRQIQTAEDQHRRGEGVPADEVLAELRMRTEERLGQSQS